jgi:colanic acid biosynthesis glycosyl transferase WcaI
MGDLAADLARLGHSVTVLTTTPHYNLDREALARQPMRRCWGGLLYRSEYCGIPVWHVRVPAKGQRVWARVLDYLRFHLLSLFVGLFALGPQDLVIATSPPLTIGVISWLLSLRLGGVSIYKVAELYPDIAIRQGIVRQRGIIAAMHWLERFVYAQNTAVVVIAEHFRRVIRARGVPEEKLVLIPDCVDTALYRPLPRVNSFAQAHHLLTDFVVLYGGNIGMVQDWGSVLFAAERLIELPIRFLLVGDGARRDWLAREVASRGLHNVTLIGYQPQEQMPEIYASCDIAMIPMTRTGSADGFPSKIYTIMACGKPVIASAEPNSELAWIIRKSGCGRVVPVENPQGFADAVLEAFQSRETLGAEGERGRQFVLEDYSKVAIARRYDILIRQLTD